MNALAATMPGGNTPTAPALQGAIDYARIYTMMNMGARTAAVLLVTDGIPNGCLSTIPQVADIATAGFTGTPPIKTFVVGMGNTAALDQVALAGSGGATHYIPTSGDVTGTLTKALGEISGMPTCVYGLPTKDGGSIDAHLVNLELKIGANTPIPIGNVSSSTECLTADGWYFDNALMPTSMQLCPASCDAIQVPRSSVQVLYGCPTVTR
jgi:hypothetical protein